MTEIKKRTQPEILKDIVYGLGQAEGACSQLVHRSGNPAAFMQIRQILELTKEGVMELAPKSLRYAEPRPRIIV